MRFIENQVRDFLMDKLSLSELVRTLGDDLKRFVHEELALVKKEMSEKLSAYRRTAAVFAAGGFVAYAGAIVLLAGLGLLIGFGFQQLGLDATLSAFIGLGIAGLITVVIGSALAIKGAKA